MARQSKNLVADICLYGNCETGAGWLVKLADGRLLGDGEPVAGRGWTTAVWLACEAIQEAGIKYGQVRIFASGGKRMAETPLTCPSLYGDLKWWPAEVYTISVEEILKAAE